MTRNTENCKAAALPYVPPTPPTDVLDPPAPRAGPSNAAQESPAPSTRSSPALPPTPSPCSRWETIPLPTLQYLAAAYRLEAPPGAQRSTIFSFCRTNSYRILWTLSHQVKGRYASSESTACDKFLTPYVLGLLECPNTPASVPILSYKLFVCGRAGAGKTATVRRLSGCVPSTVGSADTQGAEVTWIYWPLKIQGKASLFRLELWDAGDVASRKFPHVLQYHVPARKTYPQACRAGADGVLFVFSLTDKRSFEDIPRLMSTFSVPDQKSVVTVIGSRNNNKKHQEAHRGMLSYFGLQKKIQLDHVKQEVRLGDVQEFERKYRVPVFLIENGTTCGLESDLETLGPVLNVICEQLWIRDQDKFLANSSWETASEDIEKRLIPSIIPIEIRIVQNSWVELENLNTCTNMINKLETELDEANAKFRRILTESSQQIKSLSKKLGSCVEKARPYYESREAAKKAQLDCQNAALHFQRATGIHEAAKETIALAEQRFLSQKGQWEFDAAWQEMLNHATIKVMDAEHQRALSEKAHLDTTAAFAEAELKFKRLEDKLHKHALKAKPYFDLKDVFNNDLQEQKRRVQELQKEISNAKSKYSDALQNLENISDRIHARRKLEASKSDVDLDIQLEEDSFDGSYSDVDPDDEGFASVSSSAGYQMSDAESDYVYKHTEHIIQ
ncbi:unnamed protein product [Notodromas monacha]|uniref:Uncharacterized protein n=1 Tax=Notodromas monacha TaxID=399045 RepID=A0A7R9BLZ8_9CRUS|nr:unnamed protein product [Notodromas monacha]CAG0916633.1 unnamed protein product [Notodromas monacha]